IRKGFHQLKKVAVIRVDAFSQTSKNLDRINIDSDPKDRLLAHQVFEQHAASATQVEHPAAGLDPVADYLHIDRSPVRLTARSNPGFHWRDTVLNWTLSHISHVHPPSKMPEQHRTETANRPETNH